MKITFLGAAHEVTGSCTLLEIGKYKILVDCGMEQGPDIYENSELSFPPADIDFVFLTHAHIDHSGKLPLLSKNGFSGTVYTTRATRDLCAIMLADSANIQQSEAVWKDRRAKRSGEEGYTPLYTLEDVNALMGHFCTVDYGEEAEPCPGVRAVFTDAGHLLGSASIRLTLTENGERRTVVFSGDIGTQNRPLLCDPVPPDSADMVIIESTYGNRLHEGARGEWRFKLATLIDETLGKGGNLVIPSFAVGRTQELLYAIRRIKEEHLTRTDFPVYLDSPLAIEATHIYKDTLRSYFDKETNELLDRGVNPIGFEGLHLSVSSEQSKQINYDPTPKVILSASGMCEAGRIRHHLKYNLWRPESTVLFVGYQVEGTIGRKLLDGARYVTFFGEQIRVSARIEKLEGTSAHADRDELMAWLRAIPGKPRQIFVNHGADGVCDAFAADIKETLNIEATAPYSGDSFDLFTGAQREVGSRKKVSRTDSERKRGTSAVWSRLYAAGMRLMGLIERSRSVKSRELAALTGRINAICDKHEKELERRK